LLTVAENTKFLLKLRLAASTNKVSEFYKHLSLNSISFTARITKCPTQ